MKINWDIGKNFINQHKHNISFELASKVFDDPLQLTIFDKEVDGEERWHTIGKIKNMLLVLVVHTYQNEDIEIIRIISARKATSHERKAYENE